MELNQTRKTNTILQEIRNYLNDATNKIEVLIPFWELRWVKRWFFEVLSTLISFPHGTRGFHVYTFVVPGAEGLLRRFKITNGVIVIHGTQQVFLL